MRRYHDAFDYDGSDRNYDSTAIRLRSDYTTYSARLLPFDAIRCEQKINMSIFRRSCIVVVSQSNRNYDIGLSDDAFAHLLLELVMSFDCVCDEYASSGCSVRK